MSTPSLFAPVRLGAFDLRNRIFLAPMTRSRAGEGEAVGDLQATYYAQRASGGLLITEATQVSQQGVGYVRTPGIHTEAQVAGWRKVTDAVHAAGGRIFLQLWHVGRVSHTSFQPGGAAPVAPSAIGISGNTWTAAGPAPFSTPRALEADEIPAIIEDFRVGAVNALAAGFDGVEVHGANGYLPDQFLRDGSNHRTDAWGGSIENRARLLLAITDAAVSVFGKDRVGVRVSPLGGFNDMSDSNPSATFGYVAEELGKRGIAYLHVVEPVAPGLSITPLLKARFGGFVIGNGGYDRSSAEAQLAAGTVDAVAFGVPFLANPDLPARLLENAPLNPPDPSKFYAEGPEGYADYPALGA
jgi:N-ethylmaleimide reductase